MKRTLNEWGEIAASLGGLALIGGYARYAYQNTWDTATKGILIAGGVLLLAGAALGFGAIKKFFSRRSSKLGTNTLVLSLAVLAILGLLNYLGYTYHKRFDLTSEKLFSLSDQTRKIVAGLHEDVNIVRFSAQADSQFNDLMTEYKNAGSHIKFQNADPREKPDVAREYGATHVGDIVVAAGDRKQKLETNPEGGGTSEQDVTSAILKVTQGKTKTVCFVTGHGEKSLTDQDATGYSMVDQGLKREAYDTQPVNLVSSNEVPATCDILVLAGPKQPLFPQEVTMIQKYLDGGGKALVEIDPETDPKLGDLLQSWNVNLGNNVVVDASGVGRLLGLGPAVPLVVDYGDSPITKNFQGNMTFFDLARTVSQADKNKFDPQVTELLKTSSRSFTIPNLKQKEVTFDPKTDTAGPLSLGVSATRSKENGASSRLVVIGDSDFAENQFLGAQRNGDLFFNTVDWLAQDENLISIRPKSATNRRVTLTAAQDTLLRWLDLIFLPGAVILAGVAIWWRRR
jgi:ABC-type uncharacterized transport system involved in gliding motility auxiliary subunit